MSERLYCCPDCRREMEIEKILKQLLVEQQGKTPQTIKAAVVKTAKKINRELKVRYEED